ncbi:MAG: dihydropteroate synthase [Coriobacteriales bacterium]|jgi:5-methyltetrahydrofolate--homocysteine methyltransferase|nr:dihydropteroate synthase [Coriobacteriales bacterium]
MIVIGEKLNSSIPKTKELLARKNREEVQHMVVLQDEAGADFIDVNTGEFFNDEAEMMKWLVCLVQETTEKPLCIDSTSAAVLEAGLSVCERPALINSISLEGDRFEQVSRLVVEHGASVVGLCQSADKIPDNATERIEAGLALAQRLLDLGIEPERIYLDPLVTARAVDSNASVTTYQTTVGLKKELPSVKLVCGLSNVGFGLPKRKLINRSFLSMLIAGGLDGAIIDPLDTTIMTEALVAEMLVGRDFGCKKYLKAVKSGLIP